MIIGLSGYAQSGKDTVAEHLVEHYGYRRVAFADPIRKALYRLNPKIDIADMVGVPLATAVDGLGWENVKADSEDARKLLQRMGTEVGRDMFGSDIWVQKAFEDNNVTSDDKVVFTDVRFLNEYAHIKSYYGKVWRVERLGVGPANTHVSESQLDTASFDGIITNNSTKDDLYQTLDYLMQHL
jgi:dephospho-CoA kinase